MVDHNKLGFANPWHPITDPVDLKHLGKFGEELGECVSAICRCIIQGVDEKEPETNKPNKQWVQDEVADVLGNLELIIERFNLDVDYIRQRADKKKVHLRHWHNLA